MNGAVGDEVMEAPTVSVGTVGIKVNTVMMVTLLLMRRKRNV